MLLTGLALLLAACDQAVTVPGRFPEPVIEALPLKVGLIYPAAFRDYSHTETPGGSQTWTIRSGAANVALFDSVFRRLFQATEHLDALPPAGTGLDAYIVPEVADFEMALPDQSGTDQYSVWIRYTLKVYGPDAKLLTAWRINAYGQSSSRLMQPAASMEAAARQAMRDAGATISLGFAGEPAIRKALLHEAAAAEDDVDDGTKVDDAGGDDDGNAEDGS